MWERWTAYIRRNGTPRVTGNVSLPVVYRPVFTAGPQWRALAAAASLLSWG
ncbi:MAG TPA: hypothetical protein VGW38_04715 [Chloroflexota bacterium]|nr:hypothetical protein [Chloroflexota bacterium]